MADKMAASYQFAFVDNLPLSFITQFHIKLLVCWISKLASKNNQYALPNAQQPKGDICFGENLDNHFSDKTHIQT